MAYPKSIFITVPTLIIVLASAGIVAALDWPHNEDNNIDCSSCHTVHNHLGPSLITYDEINNLCKSCHYEAGPAAHAETHQDTSCTICHNSHLQDQNNIHGSTHGKLIRTEIETPNNGTKSVKFIGATGDNSFADGDPTYDAICEVCHTTTDHHRNNIEGDHTHYASEDCIDCHDHVSSLSHGGCGGCHATSGSHPTHAGNNSRGVDVECSECHNTSDLPYFDSGTDSNLDGKYELSETDVCDSCHSPGGAYDGVGVGDGSTEIGAKDNWTDGVYLGDTLVSGKEKWCAGCHDEAPAIIESVDAPKVIGDEAAAIDYGIGYGFYKTGHGLSSGDTYPASDEQGAGLECLGCHSAGFTHIDGDPRTYTPDRDYTIWGAESINYQNGYRLKDVATGYNGSYPMHIPRTGVGPPERQGGNPFPGFRASWQFALCFSCHDENALFNGGNSMTGDSPGTYFRARAGGTPSVGGNPTATVGYWYSMHDVHTWGGNGPGDPAAGIPTGQDTPQYDSDFDGTADSRIGCPACHNVHGSPSPAMIRHGELIGSVPALDFQYTPEGTYPVRDNSTGGKTRFIASEQGSVSKNGICAMCHNDETTYTRDVPAISLVEAEVLAGGGLTDTLTVEFSEGVYTSMGGGDLTSGDFILTDLENLLTITDVTHIAGASTATLKLSDVLDPVDDIRVDTVAAVSNSIYNASGKSVAPVPVTISSPSDVSPAILHPSGVASNDGFETVNHQGDPWVATLSSNDGDGSYVRRCCGGPSYTLHLHMEDPPVELAGATLGAAIVHVRARYLEGSWPEALPSARNIRIGYNTGGSTLWVGSAGTSAVADYSHISFSIGTLSLADIEDLQIAILRWTGGPHQLRITEVWVEVPYTVP